MYILSMKDETGVQKAVRLAGTQEKLAELAGVSQQAVNRWLKNGRVPHKHCRLIREKLKNRVSLAKLNPQVYGSHGEKVAA